MTPFGLYISKIRNVHTNCGIYLGYTNHWSIKRQFMASKNMFEKYSKISRSWYSNRHSNLKFEAHIGFCYTMRRSRQIHTWITLQWIITRDTHVNPMLSKVTRVTRVIHMWIPSMHKSRVKPRGFSSTNK